MSLHNDPVARALYDALMERIEPCLQLERIAQTSKELAAMAPHERKKIEKQFTEAFTRFYEEWPAFIEKSITNVKKLGKFFRWAAESREQSQEFSKIDQAIESFQEDA